MIKKMLLGPIGLSLILATTGCSKNTSSDTSGDSDDKSGQSTSDILFTNEYKYSDEDTTAEYTETTAEITLADEGVTITGKGAKATGSLVEITSGGTFVISGKLSDGQIAINAPETEQVRIILNGVDITSSKSSAIYCMQAEKLIVTLAKDTENILTDAENYTYTDESAEEPDATLFSKKDLSINGTGTLTINANFNNGIGTKDDLVISAGKINVTSKNDAIKGRDSIVVLGGEINIQSQNDGLQANNDEDETKGGIVIEDGTFNITSVHDAIQAETTMKISGGEFNLATGGGNTVVYEEVEETETTEETSDSYKGIKANGNLVVADGTFTIDSSDDAFNSNSSVQILNGEYSLSTGDQGIHADESVLIADGTINIITSNEGFEGKVVKIDGGEIDLLATDDGINASDGSSTTTAEGMAPGRGTPPNQGEASTAELDNGIGIYINGGVIKIDANGDAIDSNGNAEITGGEIYINGPSEGGNGILDADGTFNILGGTLIGVDNSDGGAPSSTSTQPSLSMYFTEQKAAGKVISIKSAAGEEIVTFTPTKEFKTLLASTPKFKTGETYTVYIDGEKVTDATLEEMVTIVSDTGEAVEQRGPRG